MYICVLLEVRCHIEIRGNPALHPKEPASVLFVTASLATAWNLLPPGTPIIGVLVIKRLPVLSVSAHWTSRTGIELEPA